MEEFYLKALKIPVNAFAAWALAAASAALI
jgi:hypothetical protein